MARIKAKQISEFQDVGAGSTGTTGQYLAWDATTGKYTFQNQPIDGAKGDTGQKGATGPQGQKGQTGATGERGDDWTSDAGEPTNPGQQEGDHYLDTDTGNVYNWNGEVWELVGSILGPQGQKGQTGATGPQGQKGEAGADGVAGSTGQKGDKGATGPTGLTGDTGEGGATGPKGDKGNTGTQGDKGNTGATGPDGDSAYGSTWEYNSTTSSPPAAKTFRVNNTSWNSSTTTIWISDDNTYGADVKPILRNLVNTSNGVEKSVITFRVPGSPSSFASFYVTAVSEETDYFELTVSYIDKGSWSPSNGDDLFVAITPIGLDGADGSTGAKGDTGAQGAKGDTGAQGAKGDTGAQGAKGDTGAQGQKGEAGADGATGAAGLTGATGPQGQKGDTGSDATISNAGNNRVVTSDGTVGGLYAESNFTYTDQGGGVFDVADTNDIDFAWGEGDSHFRVNSGSHIGASARVFGVESNDPNYGLPAIIVDPTAMLTDGIEGSWWPVIWDSTNGALGYQVSSRQFKRDIQPIDINIDLLFDKVNAVEYKFIDDDSDRVQVGFIAEEVEEWDPRFVLHDAEGNPKSLDYGRMVPALFEVIKDLRARIEILENKNN